jgi:hypothetical protein
MKKMKKFLIMLLLAVISFFLVFVAIAVAGEQVTFDGKKLIFPESSHLKPVEVSSSFEFDLGKIGQAPKDMPSLRNGMKKKLKYSFIRRILRRRMRDRFLTAPLSADPFLGNVPTIVTVPNMSAKSVEEPRVTLSA